MKGTVEISVVLEMLKDAFDRGHEVGYPNRPISPRKRSIELFDVINKHLEKTE
jgi:hypothetical protein